MKSDYPLYQFLDQELHMTVSAFAKQYGHNTSTLTNWALRDKDISTIPANVLADLANAWGKSMDETYRILIKEQ
jgi:DNA-binding transcriptional regulator YiaG